MPTLNDINGYDYGSTDPNSLYSRASNSSSSPSTGISISVANRFINLEEAKKKIIELCNNNQILENRNAELVNEAGEFRNQIRNLIGSNVDLMLERSNVVVEKEEMEKRLGEEILELRKRISDLNNSMNNISFTE